MLGTLLVEAPPSVDLIAQGTGEIDVQWEASPSAASRALEYLVFRRASGTSAFAQIARTADLRYTDAPPAGTYDYTVRTAISTFTSAGGPVATASTFP